MTKTVKTDHETAASNGPGPLRISAESMCSPEYFQKEMDTVFKKTWLNVGRVDELPDVGNYIVKEFKALNTSVLIVNTPDGIKAYHNVCPHRGNKLVCRNSSGRSKTFTCGFHGWSFDYNGLLRGVPDEQGFKDFDKSKHGLASIHADVWYGFVFINFAKKPKVSLAKSLEKATDFFEGFDFGALKVSWAKSVELECNWKVAMDGFLEQYHFAFIHQTTVADAFLDKANPYGKLDWHEYWGDNAICSILGNPSPDPTPVEKVLRGKNGIGNNKWVNTVGKGMNPMKDPNWMLDSMVFFPMFLIQPRPGGFNAWWFWPISATKSIFEFRRYEHPATNAGELFAQEHYKSIVRDTFLQDLSAFENTQSVMNSGAYTHFDLNHSEGRVAHLHNTIDKYISEVDEP